MKILLTTFGSAQCQLESGVGGVREGREWWELTEMREGREGRETLVVHWPCMPLIKLTPSDNATHM